MSDLKKIAAAVGGTYVEAKTSTPKRQTALEAVREMREFKLKNKDKLHPIGNKMMKFKGGKWVLVPYKKTKPSTRREQLK